ncbi:TRAP transporter small permease subunit [Aquincola sp. MAHUQ-54]|uniref:TRAP transporter small permease protein n=1 Tax=Aquincola agrisoli TaxID=3119538 RepID=A0AAW9QH88_9BURK
MNAYLRFADRLSTRVGQAFAWLIVVLVAIMVYEVFSRYVLGNPHDWVFDVSIMCYGAVFLMGGAYTLAKENHVRGDILYGFLPPRVQAGLDLLLYGLFFCPGVLALMWAGWGFAGESWAVREHSANTADGPPIYPVKMLIPLAGALLLMQGAAEVLRCIACLRSGHWAPREQDVEEVDVDKLKALVREEGTP